MYNEEVASRYWYEWDYFAHKVAARLLFIYPGYQSVCVLAAMTVKTFGSDQAEQSNNITLFCALTSWFVWSKVGAGRAANPQISIHDSALLSRTTTKSAWFIKCSRVKSECKAAPRYPSGHSGKLSMFGWIFFWETYHSGARWWRNWILSLCHLLLNTWARSPISQCVRIYQGKAEADAHFQNCSLQFLNQSFPWPPHRVYP
jgi:hypothetical protein